MDKKDLEKTVAEIVAAAFNEKEEAEIRKNVEAELNKSTQTISDLTSALEAKNTEVSELEAQASEKDEKVTQLEAELEAAKQELETTKAKLTDTEKDFEELKKDRLMEQRAAELESAGVVSSDKEAQLAKVRDMSDEDFASYKSELESIRASVMEEIERTKQTTEDTTSADDTEETASTEEETSEETETDETEEEETASEEETDDSTSSETAGLNLEGDSTDLKAKYAELGQAMADVWKRS